MIDAGLFFVFYFVCFYINEKKIFRISALVRGGSRTAATSKMESFLIIVNGFQT